MSLTKDDFEKVEQHHVDYRREMDKQLLELIKTYQDGFCKLSDEIHRYSRDMLEVKSDIKLLVQRLDDRVICVVDEHQKTLHGLPEALGQTGVVSEVQSLKAQVRSIKSSFVLFWGAGITILSSAVSYFVDRLLK